MARFEVTFWGVRGSYPVSGKETMHYGGNTTCIEVRIRDQIFVIDAGTGVIRLGDAITGEYFGLKKSGNVSRLGINMLFTHYHHDHTQGLPFFKPIYLGDTQLNIFGPSFTGTSGLEGTITKLFDPPHFPLGLAEMGATITWKSLRPGDSVVLSEDDMDPVIMNEFRDPAEEGLDIKISFLHSRSHPTNGVYIYKFEHQGKSFVFATDIEGYVRGDTALAQFCKGVTVLAHDAQYTMDHYSSLPVPTQGWGHSTPEMALQVAQNADVEQLVLIHHDPNSSDSKIRAIEAAAKDIFPSTIAAYEGLTLTLAR